MSGQFRAAASAAPQKRHGCPAFFKRTENGEQKNPLLLLNRGLKIEDWICIGDMAFENRSIPENTGWLDVPYGMFHFTGTLLPVKAALVSYKTKKPDDTGFSHISLSILPQVKIKV